jgi:8-oxo-dGTP pyrophosphatase MutT (NUDIX family)
MSEPFAYDGPPLPLPTADLVERARAFRVAGAEPTPTKSSATVVLLRDAASTLEVFMLRRLAAMSFAGGMHVFPGGVVDPSDESPTLAAIRETFEESGVLLADGIPADKELLERDRLALIEHRATFAEVMNRHQLVARPDLLRPWSRWITPVFEPRRYDTHFFVALVPGGQQARDVGGESDDATWTTPTDALASAARGEWSLMPPTETTLRELLRYRTAEEAVVAAKTRTPYVLQADVDLAADPPVFTMGTLS